MAFQPRAAPEVGEEENVGVSDGDLEEGAGAFFDQASDGESGGEDDQQEDERGSHDEDQVCEFVPVKGGQGGGWFYLSWTVPLLGAGGTGSREDMPQHRSRTPN